jgi:alpha-glucosidase
MAVFGEFRDIKPMSFRILFLISVMSLIDLPAFAEMPQIQTTPATSRAIRLSISYDGQASPLRSIFIASPTNRTSTGFQNVAGQLLVDRQSGRWTLRDPGGKIIIAGDLGALINDKRTGQPTVQIKIDRAGGANERFYGSGGGRGGSDNLLHLQGDSTVAGGYAMIPYYWSSAGYAAFAVTTDDNAPASWDARSTKSVIWNFPGKRADLYLIPAANLYDAAQAYAELTGYPAVPPRWTFGYLQSRWGWKDRAYIDDTAKQFIDRKLPVDAFIFDFEWFTRRPDYKLPPQGAADYPDFSWNPPLFPDPAGQIAQLKKQGIHFVAIRKPRLGNSATLVMARRKGWILPQGNGVDARCLDFANADCRDWYAQQLVPLLKNGIDGWWDDEGEITVTTYYWWNQAQAQALAAVNPAARLWTIDRSFEPGLQRFGASAWTGDIASNWATLAKTPGDLLNWSLAGMDYGACDIGGFLGNDSPELLTRWMQAGVFFPVMRAHSLNTVRPRFPWLYGQAAEDAIRKALNLRYRLIPMYYSLAHLAHEAGAPLMRPLVMEFPTDPKVADMTSEWLIGRGLLAAPILNPGNRREIYLPDDDWYVLGSNERVAGNRLITVDSPLDQIPIYVRAGTILPLCPAIQHTDQLLGGPLEVQIYPGKDADFTLVEDDGQTKAYLDGQIRRTKFHWNDAARQLSWNISGPYNGNDVFTSIQAVVFDTGQIKRAQAPLSSDMSLLITKK